MRLTKENVDFSLLDEFESYFVSFEYAFTDNPKNYAFGGNIFPFEGSRDNFNMLINNAPALTTTFVDTLKENLIKYKLCRRNYFKEDAADLCKIIKRDFNNNNYYYKNKGCTSEKLCNLLSLYPDADFPLIALALGLLDRDYCVYTTLLLGDLHTVSNVDESLRLVDIRVTNPFSIYGLIDSIVIQAKDYSPHSFTCSHAEFLSSIINSTFLRASIESSFFCNTYWRIFTSNPGSSLELRSIISKENLLLVDRNKSLNANRRKPSDFFSSLKEEIEEVENESNKENDELIRIQKREELIRLQEVGDIFLKDILSSKKNIKEDKQNNINNDTNETNNNKSNSSQKTSFIECDFPDDIIHKIKFINNYILENPKESNKANKLNSFFIPEYEKICKNIKAFDKYPNKEKLPAYNKLIDFKNTFLIELDKTLDDITENLFSEELFDAGISLNVAQKLNSDDLLISLDER